MNYTIGNYILRLPEQTDIEELYRQKNDPEISNMLVGFTMRYSRADISEWIEFHRKCASEIVWVVAEADTDRCVGHVGIYEIDNRVGSGEFGIMLGDRTVWGKGLGRACVEFAACYAFDELNLNRLSLTVLSTNERAMKLYRSVGFIDEGRMRQAQYKSGQYVDVLMMGLLKSEYRQLSLSKLV